MAEGDRYINSVRKNLGLPSIFRKLIREDANGKPYLAKKINPISYPSTIYGATRFQIGAGSSIGNGNIWSYNYNTNSFSNLHTFSGSPSSSQGYGGVIKGSDGLFYGTTNLGGSSNVGSFYSFDADTGTLTVLHSFVSATHGSSPQSSVIEVSQGLFYGVCRSAGGSQGTLWSYETNTTTFTVKHVFSTGANGSNPISCPILASNGKLYGTTLAGGTNNVGCIYSYDINTSTFTNHFSFTAATSGSQIIAGLLQASNGLLYGASNIGGVNNFGTIFSFDIDTNTFTKLYDCISTEFRQIQCRFIQSQNGKLYICANSVDGAATNGAFIEFDINTSTPTKLHTFSQAVDGARPVASVVEVGYGIFVGSCQTGQAPNLGTLWVYDTNLSSLTIKYVLNTNGGPQPGELHGY